MARFRRPASDDRLRLKRRINFHMTFVITEPCIGTKDTSCVEACPVDCIHPLPAAESYGEARQLYIDPAECIDCAACVPVCPVEAIFADDEVPEQWTDYIDINARYFD